MPSFDLVSKLDAMELKNAVAMAQKEIANRYDLKNSNSTLELFLDHIEILAPDDMKINAALDILRTRMVKRNLGVRNLEVEKPIPTGARMLKLVIKLKSGVDKEQAKIIQRVVKDSGLKVTTQYMDEKVRFTGKKIDDLQMAFAKVRASEEVKIDLQMDNMKRD